MRPLSALLACTALALPAAAQQFVYDNLALPAQAVWTDGVELADVDGDGDVDILFANGSFYGGTGGTGAQPQHLFLNNGSGSFSAAHGNLNVANFNAKMVIAEDFDNDGDLDLMYASGSTGSPPRLLINQGFAQSGTQGIFQDVTATNVPALALRSFCVAAGDVDDDGDLDVAVSDGGTFGGVASQLRLLENDGSAVFTEITSKLPTDTYNCQDITMIDYDNDFDVDIALSGKGAAGKRGRLYLNQGDGTFVVSTAHDALGTGATYEIDWGDLDGDGDFDGAVQSIASQSEGWARNDGPTTAVTKFTFPTPNGNDDNEMACMDYDNDGDLDVFVGSLATTEKLYRNDGGGTWVSQSNQIQSQSDSTLDLGFADLDGDDDYDLVTGQGESGVLTNKVYDNTGGPDTLAPVFVATSVPTRIGAPATVFHAQIRDAISDDGHIGCTMSFAYTTNVGSGSGTATHMGGGLFRAAVPSGPGLESIAFDWTATDSVGNSSTTPTINVGGVYTYVGHGTNGIDGMPTLTLNGPQTGGSNFSITVAHAGPGALMLLWIATPVSTPVGAFGGTIHAFPFSEQVLVSADGSGGLFGQIVWPIGLPPGIEAWWQIICQDNSVIWGATLSNAMKSTTP